MAITVVSHHFRIVECRDAGPLPPGGFMVNRSMWQIAAAAVETP